MASCYVFLALVASVVALSESLQLHPDCSQLRPYALPYERRLDLFFMVEALAPPKDVGLKVEYQCALEGLAGLILESPQKPLTCPSSLGIFPVIFETDGNKDVKVADKEAVNSWKNHIPYLGLIHGFGCNYRKEDGRHKYLCLFK